MLLNADQNIILERVRACAKEVRCYPRLDMFQACQLIGLDVDLYDAEALEIFIRTIPQALGRKINVNLPFTNDISFDEKWVIAVIEAVTRADYDSVHFLITSTIDKRYQQQTRQLCSALWKITA